MPLTHRPLLPNIRCLLADDSLLQLCRPARIAVVRRGGARLRGREENGCVRPCTACVVYRTTCGSVFLCLEGEGGVGKCCLMCAIACVSPALTCLGRYYPLHTGLPMSPAWHSPSNTPPVARCHCRTDPRLSGSCARRDNVTRMLGVAVPLPLCPFFIICALLHVCTRLCARGQSVSMYLCGVSVCIHWETGG